jgi:hypothetical protein
MSKGVEVGGSAAGVAWAWRRAAGRETHDDPEKKTRGHANAQHSTDLANRLTHKQIVTFIYNKTVLVRLEMVAFRHHNTTTAHRHWVEQSP